MDIVLWLIQFFLKMCELGLRKNIIWKYLFIEVVLLVSTTNYFQSIYKNGWYIPFTISKLYAIIWKLGWIVSVKDTNAHITISLEFFCYVQNFWIFDDPIKTPWKILQYHIFFCFNLISFELRIKISWICGPNSISRKLSSKVIYFFVNLASSTSIYFKDLRNKMFYFNNIWQRKCNSKFRCKKISS
jgi:hypothetical protein